MLLSFFVREEVCPVVGHLWAVLVFTTIQYLQHENYNEFVRLYENKWKALGLGTVIFIVSYLLLVPT